MKKLKQILIIILITILIASNLGLAVGLYSSTRKNQSDKDTQNGFQDLNDRIISLEKLVTTITSDTELESDKLAAIEAELSQLHHDITKHDRVITAMSSDVNIQEELVQKLNGQIARLSRSFDTQFAQTDSIQKQLEEQYVSIANEFSSLIEYVNEKLAVELVENINWRITTEHNNVYGPYLIDDEFLFIYPDGSYSIITVKGETKKTGKMDFSVFGEPVYSDKKVYSISRSGVLTCFDFTDFRQSWETTLTVPSSIALINAGGYILFATPDYQVSLIHKDTGIVTDKLSLSAWLYQPLVIDEMMGVFTEAGLVFYEYKNGFIESNTIPHNFVTIQKADSVHGTLIVQSEDSVFVYDGISAFQKTEAQLYYSFSNSMILTADDAVYQVINYSIELRKGYPESAIYINREWSVSMTASGIVIKNDIHTFLIETDSTVKEIYQTGSVFVLVTEDNLIYGRGLLEI